jgi:hypothetical protein
VELQFVDVSDKVSDQVDCGLLEFTWIQACQSIEHINLLPEIEKLSLLVDTVSHEIDRLN